MILSEGQTRIWKYVLSMMKILLRHFPVGSLSSLIHTLGDVWIEDIRTRNMNANQLVSLVYFLKRLGNTSLACKQNALTVSTDRQDKAASIIVLGIRSEWYCS